MMFFLGSILEFTAKMRGQANDQLWYSPHPGQVYSVARMLFFFELSGVFWFKINATLSVRPQRPIGQYYWKGFALTFSVEVKEDFISSKRKTLKTEKISKSQNLEPGL